MGGAAAKEQTEARSTTASLRTMSELYCLHDRPTPQFRPQLRKNKPLTLETLDTACSNEGRGGISLVILHTRTRQPREEVYRPAHGAGQSRRSPKIRNK